jgi:two-component system response regulator
MAAVEAWPSYGFVAVFTAEPAAFAQPCLRRRTLPGSAASPTVRRTCSLGSATSVTCSPEGNERALALEPKTILLVEDNADDEQLTLRAMRQSDIPNIIRVARDGAEALEKLFGTSLERLPDLVLLDLKLPKVNGLEVLQKIRANELTKTLPVVVLTSSDEERDIVESYELGANSYIRKPVDFDQFIDAVRQLGLYWLSMNRAGSTKDPS